MMIRTIHSTKEKLCGLFNLHVQLDFTIEDEDIFPKDFNPSMYRPYTQEEILVAVFEYDWLYMTVGMFFPWAYQELEKSSKSNSKKGSKKKKK